MGKRDTMMGVIEIALDPGRFVGDRGCFSFVDDLEDVAEQIRALVAKEPARAAELYEAFIAGCYEKAEEVDDSSGSLGMFVGELFCGWVKARQAAGAAPDETAHRLLQWMDEDPYGFCHGIEDKLVKVLDRDNLAAFEREVRVRFDAAPTTLDASGYQPYPRRHWGDVLRETCAARGDIKAYLAVCDGTRLVPKDCLAVAQMLRTRKKASEALSWVEKGLRLDRGRAGGAARGELEDLKRELLKKLGRGEDALQLAWKEFVRWPHEITYKELMRYVPKENREAWHAKAIEAASKAAPRDAIPFLAEHGEVERLAERVRRVKDVTLEEIGYHSTEDAAKLLAKSEPVLAGRIHQAHGMSVLKAGKSKHYPAALGHFEEAKRCYERAGHPEAWEKLVEKTRTEHSRKTGFLESLQQIGKRAKAEPSFLERARSRWLKSQRT